MEQKNNVTINIDEKINTNTVLFFDMDGTLVFTNFANFLAYREAIISVTGSNIDIQYNPKERFNRRILKSLIPSLNEIEYEKIIKEKEKYYKDFLPETKLNRSVANILFKYAESNTTVLVTKCRKDRVLLTLNYFGLSEKFNNIFHKQFMNETKSKNKYLNAISQLGICASNIIVFENESQEINDAIEAGINHMNILTL